LTLTPDGGAVIVWDEIMNGTGRVSMSRVSRADAFVPPQVLSERESASFPVTVPPANGDLLVAWTSRSSPDQSMIRLRRLSVQR